MKLAWHNGNKTQYNEISTTETSHNTTKLAHQPGIRRDTMKLAQCKGKQAATQQN